MRRGQAALEYLFTYGWAFLAILITIGVLAYFGVFDFSNLKSPECTFPPGVVCEDYVISDEISGVEEVRFDVRNVFGVDLDVLAMNATDERVGLVPCDAQGAAYPVDWAREEVLTFNCTIPQGVYADGQFYDFTIRGEFEQDGEDYTHTLLGWVATNAQ